MGEDNDGVEPHGGAKHVCDGAQEGEVAEGAADVVHPVQVEHDVRLVALERPLCLKQTESNPNEARHQKQQRNPGHTWITELPHAEATTLIKP